MYVERWDSYHWGERVSFAFFPLDIFNWFFFSNSCPPACVDMSSTKGKVNLNGKFDIIEEEDSFFDPYRRCVSVFYLS